MSQEIQNRVIAWKNFPRGASMMFFGLTLAFDNYTSHVPSIFISTLLFWLAVWFITNFIPLLRDIYVRNAFIVIGWLVMPIGMWFPIRWIVLIMGALIFQAKHHVSTDDFLGYVIGFILFDIVRIFVFRPDYTPKIYHKL